MSAGTGGFFGFSSLPFKQSKILLSVVEQILKAWGERACALRNQRQTAEMSCLISLPCTDNLMVFNTTYIFFQLKYTPGAAAPDFWVLPGFALYSMCQRMMSCLALPRVTAAFPHSPCTEGSWSSMDPKLHHSPGVLAIQQVSCGPPGPWVSSVGCWAEHDLPAYPTMAKHVCWCCSHEILPSMSFKVFIRKAPTLPTSFSHESILGCHPLAPSPLLPSQLCQGEMET